MVVAAAAAAAASDSAPLPPWVTSLPSTLGLPWHGHVIDDEPRWRSTVAGAAEEDAQAREPPKLLQSEAAAVV